MTQQTMLIDDLYHEPLVPAPSPAEQERARAVAEGERLRRVGMERAALAGASLLGVAREFAHDIAMENGGLCNADLVALAMKAEGYPRLKNSAGSIFTDGNWEWTGDRTNATRSQSHSNELKVWRRIR